MVKAHVMTDEQYTHAESALVLRLQTMREAEMGARALIPKFPNEGEPDSDDDVYEQPVSSEYQAAFNEWMTYGRRFKRKKNYPKTFAKEGFMQIGGIQLGQPEEKGEDLEASHPFVRCNLADFIRDGHFDLILFLEHNAESFPYIYKLACCLASLRTNEVGCERFFSIAGYVSNPRRSRLNVHHYESMAMLKQNMRAVYIDEKWVVNQYLALSKSKGWNEAHTQNDKRVTELEWDLFSEELGIPSEDIPEVVFVEDNFAVDGEEDCDGNQNETTDKS
jgi:hAT family C-terminal dimerisation region